MASIVFLLVVGRVLATATLQADRIAAAAKARRRFVWIVGLTLTAFWPVIAIAVSYVGDVALSRGLGFGGVREPRHWPMIHLAMPSHSVPARAELAFVVLWLLASTVLLLRLALFAFLSWRWRRTLPMVVVDGIRVRLSKNAGPAIGGPIAMDVILPAWVVELDPLERSLVVGHELSHRAARDIYWLWYGALLVAIAPWNILVWWQAARLRQAVEMDCDARVLTALSHPLTYMRMLVRCAGEPRERSWSHLAPSLVGEANHLEQRIAAISSQQTSSPLTCVIHGVMMVSALLAALALRPPTSIAQSLAVVPPATPPVWQGSSVR